MGFPIRRAMRRYLPGVLALVAWSGPAVAADPTAVADGTDVSIEYTLKITGEDAVVDSNVGKEPLTYGHGKQQIVPGLEQAMTGLKVGDTKHVAIKAADAYGAYDDSRKVTVERSQVPADAKAGTTLVTGEGMPVKLVEVTDDKAVIDLNHPLAGKDLEFDVKVVKIAAAAAPEAAPAAAPAAAADATK